jgi:hypothetical protein
MPTFFLVVQLSIVLLAEFALTLRSLYRSLGEGQVASLDSFCFLIASLNTAGPTNSGRRQPLVVFGVD